MNWEAYPNFTEAEFRCRVTGECVMASDYMEMLQRLRTVFGLPMIITDGYRGRKHPRRTAAHRLGKASDIAVSGEPVFRLLRLAVIHGFTGIGLKQHGKKRFIHLDTLSADEAKGLRPRVWTYSR